MITLPSSPSPTVSRAYLAQLANAVGVSGGESDVRQLVMGLIKDRASDVLIDPLGSLLMRIPGTGESPLRIMISAHMDEVGLMVADIGDNGLIDVMAVGTLDPRYAPARRVVVGSAKTPGVLLWTPIHYNKVQTIIAPEDMRVDVGADGRGGVNAEPGDRIAFWSEYTELTPTVARGKAFDSRAGCAVLIALLDLLDGAPLPFDLHLAFTGQAHIGGRGALVAANRIKPDAAFVLTAMVANDLPKLPDADRAPLIELGGGPVISIRDARAVLDRKLADHVRATADSTQIAYQFEALVNRPAQASAISQSRSGVPSLTLGVPVRYLGSPNALLNLTDLDQLALLLHATLSTLTPDILEQ
jgi:endoglucanase